MTRLASRFGASNLIRRDRPLTREELFRVVPSVFSETNTNPAVNVIPIFRLYLCWKVYSGKASSHSLPVRPGYAILAVMNIRSTCCACAGRSKLPVSRCRKLSCLTPMMVPARTRCCRACSGLFVKTVLSVANPLARYGCHTRGMW